MQESIKSGNGYKSFEWTEQLLDDAANGRVSIFRLRQRVPFKLSADQWSHPLRRNCDVEPIFAAGAQVTWLCALPLVFLLTNALAETPQKLPQKTSRSFLHMKNVEETEFVDTLASSPVYNIKHTLISPSASFIWHSGGGLWIKPGFRRFFTLPNVIQHRWINTQFL